MIKNPVVLLTLFNTLLRYCWNVNLKYNVKLRYFWEQIWETLLLFKSIILRLKIISWAWLFGSGLKLILHWKAKSSIHFQIITLDKKKWSFPLRISSVYVTKSAGNCGFTKEILNWKLHFLWSVTELSQRHIYIVNYWIYIYIYR